MCKSIGKSFGQIPRFSTNYDTTFLSILISSFLGVEPEIKNSNCILNPFKKRPKTINNSLLDRVNNANILLVYYKLVDAKEDREGFKMRIAKLFFKRSYKRAVKNAIGIDIIINYRYEGLRALEKENCTNIDKVADCFASMIKEIASSLIVSEAENAVNIKPITATENLTIDPDPFFVLNPKSSLDEFLSLCYNIGKFVYLIDALDDIEKDKKKNSYNPFINAKTDQIEISINACINRAIESFNNIAHCFKFGYTVLENIVHKGLREKYNSILLKQAIS